MDRIGGAPNDDEPSNVLSLMSPNSATSRWGCTIEVTAANDRESSVMTRWQPFWLNRTRLPAPLCIRGRGVPQASGKTSPRGDHLVHIQVEVSTEPTARQRELIEELAQSTGESREGGPPKRRLLDRVRSLLEE